ncbi:HAMP domain-containing protein [Vibrio cholerae]|nr:HAMP domain-containing protein [Vibrio cholerae]
MSLTTRHTIGARLLLAFAFSTSLLTIVSLVAWGTWSRLDYQVAELLNQSVPKYNTSYVLETRSSEIRRRIQLIVSATSKVTLNQQYQRLQEDFTAIHAALASLPQNEQQAALQQGYTELRQTTQQINDLVSARIDVDRRLALFAEQLDWLHQDIGMELSPMRQELQWQLERGGAAQPQAQVMFQTINLIQTILDGETQAFLFVDELLKAKHLTQVDNGMRVLQYRLDELSRLSQPLFTQPSSIAYQQLLEEWRNVLRLEGDFQQSLRDRVMLTQKLESTSEQLQIQLDQQHTAIADLVANADALFVQVKGQTAQLVQEGNRVLLICFGLSIGLSLLLMYYFVHKRIVGRLHRLSESLDAIIHNDLSHPISVDGKDEIGTLSEQLILYGKKVEEMERTNALSLINNTQASLITCDRYGQIESANPSAMATLRLESLAQPLTLWSCFAEHVQSKVGQLFDTKGNLIQKGAESLTLSLGNPEKPHYLRLYLRRYSQGLHDKIIVTITDVTDQEHANRLLEQRVKEKTQSLREKNRELQAEVEERQRAEAHLKKTQGELIQAAKMAVVGQTMTSLAHELNQPLSAMSAYLFSARLALDEAPQVQLAASLDHIENLTERMGKIVNSLRHFARKNSSDESLQPVRLNSVVEQALVLVQTKAKRQQIKLINTLPDDLMVMADALSLEQILINLIVNGCDASTTCTQPWVKLIALGTEQGIQRIAVIDSGQGFEHEVVDKLFTPFTTTKEVGLGLGLSICQSLVEKMQGRIALASNLEKGAMVILELQQDEKYRTAY